MSDGISIIASMIAILSAVYARWSATEAKKANDIGRLNALLSFRAHYIELMSNKANIVKQLKGTQGAERAHEAYAELDAKLREVNQEIDSYHKKVVDSKI